MRRRRRSMLLTVFSSNRNAPESARATPARIERRVDLPHPFFPRMQVIEPSDASILTPLRTVAER